VPTLADLLSRERLLLDLRVGSKRELFQELAAAVEAATGIDQMVALAALVQREKLGTTGIGDGLALPHARLPGLVRPLAFFARLARPVDYDALDERPVDLVLALVAPEEDNAGQLKALAQLARLLRDPVLTGRLRREADPARVYDLLTGRAAERD
jgi:PTS system nitrogen regulatory IIA component